MSFLKKIAKGFKGVVKGIGRTVKKAVAGVGKFMNKIGIVGQIGLALVLPGIGSMLGGWATSMAASSSALVKGAGQLLGYAVQAGQAVGGFFQSVTQGVSSVIGETVGAVLNKIPGMDKIVSSLSGGRFNIADKTFQSAWKTAQSAVSDVATAGGNIFSSETYDLSKLATKKVEETVAQKAVETGVKTTEQVIEEGVTQAVSADDKVASMLETPTIDTNLSADISSQALEGIQTAGTQATKKAKKSLFEEAKDRAIAKAKELPTKAVDYTAEKIAKMPGEMLKQKTYQVTGLAPEAPDQNIFYADVPNIMEQQNFSLLAPEQQFATYQQAQFQNAMQVDSQMYNSKTYQHRASAFGGGFA